MKKYLTLLLVLLLCPHAGSAQTPDDEMRQRVEAIIKNFERKKYDEVIAEVDTVEAEGDQAAFLLNLKGAAYTKKEDYESAKKAFEAALEKSPGMFAAIFNLGEIKFLQKQYSEALDWFRGMLINDPRNELLQFKVFLCNLQMGEKGAAKKALDAMRYPPDSPAWYYAQAAWELSQGNKSRASDYLAGARYIFEGKTELFDETFTDLGLPTR